MVAPAQIEIVKASVIQAATNTVINGLINYFMLRGKEAHLITADSITSGHDTVIGHSVFTAVILALIFTLLGFNAHKRHLTNVGWRKVGGLAAKNAIYAFGLIVIFGVLWQKMFPNVSIGTLGAATLAGLIAGAVSGITNFNTLSSLLKPAD